MYTFKTEEIICSYQIQEVIENF